MAETIWKNLTEAELNERRDELAGLVSKLDDLRDEKKQTMKDFSSQERAYVRRQRELAQAIRAKGEYAPDDRQAALFGEKKLRKVDGGKGETP